MKQCLIRHVKLKSGDWTAADIADIIARYQRREIDLEDCLEGVMNFYNGLKNKMAKG